MRTGLMSTSSPLVIASCKGHDEVVAALLEHPEIRVNEAVSGGWTALMWASWYGQVNVVKLLLQTHGIKTDKLNSAGKNAVMYAAEAGKLEVGRLLLAGIEDEKWGEEDRAERKSRLDRLLDQALLSNCDVPLAKMILALRDESAAMMVTTLGIVQQ